MECTFAHRVNRDGTADSICLKCFATVAMSNWEADLEAEEREHSCDRVRIEHFEILRASLSNTPVDGRRKSNGQS